MVSNSTVRIQRTTAVHHWRIKWTTFTTRRRLQHQKSKVAFWISCVFERFLSKKFVFCSITNSTPFHAKQKIDAKSSPGNVMFKYSAAFGFPSLTSRWVVLMGCPGEMRFQNQPKKKNESSFHRKSRISKKNKLNSWKKKRQFLEKKGDQPKFDPPILPSRN